MSISQNRIKRSVSPKAVFEEIGLGQGLSSSVTCNQGDLLVYDATNHVIKVAAAESEGSTFLGISRVKIVNGVVAGPYAGLATTGQEAISATPGPQYGLSAALVLKSGDALAHGANVYLDPSDGAEFVQASGTKSIGVYQGVAITGDGTKTVEILLGSRYPNDTLKF